MYVNYVYYILKADTVGLDAVYEDFIINRVGTAGLEALKQEGLLEACGIVKGRQLYVLC